VIADRSRFFLSQPSLLRALAYMALSTIPCSARAGLDEYVKKPDTAYAWSKTADRDTPAGTITTLALTSQVWQGITWKHELSVYEPREMALADAMMLFITGGSHDSKQNDSDHKQAFMLAQLCGARVAVLRQVPNQPLLDGKTEDELIAETFVRYLKTGDENWPLLFPMAKSAVRAMDALQAFAKEKGKPVTRFVVTGASKRGWTTWLTGAVDDRVIAIAPMVIVMLNLGTQGPNQLKVWGQYSEQIGDYVQRGLMEKTDTPAGTKLWKMVDPYTYRERLAKPKLLINGANDRYWTLNAIDFYWNDLEGPKFLTELPNAGHGLEQHRDWVLGGLGAFFRHVATSRPMPKIKWEMAAGAGGESTMTIHASPPPVSARIWTARSDSRDFRESRWDSAPLKPGETITRYVPKAPSGNIVYFGELEYQIDGVPYHLTTTFMEPGAPPPVAKSTRP
jgi:PhoPQ-activated pathogenicity-related protein